MVGRGRRVGNWGSKQNAKSGSFNQSFLKFAASRFSGSEHGGTHSISHNKPADTIFFRTSNAGAACALTLALLCKEEAIWDAECGLLNSPASDHSWPPAAMGGWMRKGRDDSRERWPFFYSGRLSFSLLLQLVPQRKGHMKLIKPKITKLPVENVTVIHQRGIRGPQKFACFQLLHDFLVLFHLTLCGL